MRLFSLIKTMVIVKFYMIIYKKKIDWKEHKFSTISKLAH